MTAAFFFTYRSSLFTFFRTFAREMENSVRHEGTIESIEGRHIRVRIVQNSACAACKVASRCNASESKIKIVDVYDEEAAKTHQVGDSVVVSTSSRSAGRALLLGFGLPLAMMLAVLVVLLLAGVEEGIAALGAIGILAPYYIAIWLMREHIAEKISFGIDM